MIFIRFFLNAACCKKVFECLNKLQRTKYITEIESNECNTVTEDHGKDKSFSYT